MIFNVETPRLSCPSCSPLPALWAHLTPAGLPGPSALYQTSRHQGLTRLLQARGALRVGSVIMARPHIVEQTDLPVKGQIFHREAENRLFRRPREAKKLNFK